MSRQLGRISGPLLEANLLRNGVDLSFSNDRFVSPSLLYLDVNNNRIGIKNNTPIRDLQINDTWRTPHLIADTSAVIGDLEWTSSQIENLTGNINITAPTYVAAPNIRNTDIEISDNYITTYTPNTNLVFDANGSGRVIIDANDTIFENNLTVNGSTLTKDINLTGTLSAPNIYISKDIFVDRDAQFENIKISQNNISTTISNSNIDLSPGGSGSVEIFADTNVTGSLHASGNITMDGNITLGDQDTDSIILNADVASDILPDISNTYNLGSPAKQWTTINSTLLNGIDIDTAVITVASVNIGTPTGNIFYVAVNGDDSNRGDHPQGPFATIKHALSVADSSVGGPTTIYIYPGDYQEELPLVVPSQTTVKGHNLRNTFIRPTTSTQSEDVFLLNGETTVENLTVKDIFYDAVNDKGYAFRFAPGLVVSSRSPYIRNVSVITQGSSTSPSDPRGFASGDAGKGALVDGAEVLSSSLDASMLFHSVTFITPGVDALTMRGGVRVEWLNSFTYFANRGLYAENDSAGRLSYDGSTILKGAELRSIGSANVYGNYGAVADGDQTLMYLINHNFAYIGTGKDVSNDATLVIQDNEAVELNSGRIYYTSQDALGNFRVGDTFLVDFEKGTTNISGAGVGITGLNSLTINTGGQETFINSEKIETGNWRISGNTLAAQVGDANVVSASGEINLISNVNMASNLTMTGNFTMSGANFTLGDTVGDTVNFDAEITSDVVPNAANTYNLGSESKTWKKIWLSELNVDDIVIKDNIIQTVESNSDLELRANGSGVIRIPNNLAEFFNDVRINGTTSLQQITINNGLALTGNTAQIGNIDISGNATISGIATLSGTTTFEDVQINGNVITTTQSNSDLEFRAAGSGDVIVPNEDVQVDNDITVNGLVYANNINVNTSLDMNDLVVRNNIQIDDNFITTTISNSNLELRAQGTGTILLDNNNFVIDNDLTVDGTSSLQNTTVNGTLTKVGTTNQVGNFAVTGSSSVTGNITTGSKSNIESILIDGNVITTTVSNADLELRANGTGTVKFNRNTVFQDNVQVSGTVYAGDVTVNTSLDINNLIGSSNILIDDNFITTTESNSNLELRANGTGTVNLEDIQIDSNIISTASSDIDLKTNSNNVLVTSNKALILPVGPTSGRTNQKADLRFNTNFNIFEGYALANVGFNGIYSDNYRTKILAGETNNTLEFYVNNTQVGSIIDGLDFHSLQVDDININNNTISTNVSNSNLEFSSNSNGNVNIDHLSILGNTITNLAPGELTLANTGFGSVKIPGSGGFALTSGTTAERRSNPQTGETRYNESLQYLEVFNGTEWITSVGIEDTVTEEEFEDLLFEYTLLFG